MPVEKFGDGGFLVTGDSIRAVAEMNRLRNWRRNAEWVTKFGGKPSAGMSVRRFCEYYDLPAGSVTTWAQVLQVTTDTLAEIHNQRGN